MEKAEVIKEVRALLAAKQTEQSVLSFLADIGFNDTDAKDLLKRAKEGYAIEADLERLKSIEKQLGEPEEEEKELSPQEKRVRYVKDQITDIQEIIKSMKGDINSPQDKKGATTAKKTSGGGK